MELKNQVSNKELSIKLRDLGVPQNTLFHWCKLPLSEKEGYENDEEYGIAYDWVLVRSDSFSAYTCSELGEIMKPYFNSEGKLPDELLPRDLNLVNLIFDANYWAKMLIYLLKNSLIKLK